MDNLLNKFFTYADPRLVGDKLLLDLEPNFFWSRLYEYEFCKQFIVDTHTVCDMACGTDSLFKFFLSAKCGSVYGCDIEDIREESVLEAVRARHNPTHWELGMLSDFYKRMSLTQCSIDNTPYADEMFDTIFCISVFEHMPKEVQQNTLKEFKRVLKNSGKIVLTCDYPTIDPNELIIMAKEAGLELCGEYDYTIPYNHIQTDYFGYNCKCFSMVLTHFVK